MRKFTFLATLFFITIQNSFSQDPWGHRYSAQQSNQNVVVDINTNFTVSVEWNQGDWTASDFGYGYSTDGSGWTWVNLPYFEDGENNNKRCKTTISITIPGKYYYAYRFIKNSTTSYSFGSDEWLANSTSLIATSTISVGEFTISNGNWSSTDIWNGMELPSDTKNVGVYHSVTLNQDGYVKSLFIHNDKTFTASDGNARTLTISSGGTLTNNGTFTASDGTVVFAGAGTVSGTIGFNNVEIKGAVNFGSSSSLSGTLTVNGGYANSNSITYNSGSKLKYSSAYDIGSGDQLWYSNTPSTGFAQKGVPWNVEIDNVLVQLNDSYPFYLNGSLLNNGTFRLGTANNPYYGDFYIRGDFTDNGTFNANSRSINFNGTSTQTISGTSTTSFAYFNTVSGSIVVVDSDKKLTISDGMNINSSSTFTLNSDADGTTASLIVGASSALGNVTVQRYLDEASKAATWHYVSSPVSGQAIDNDWLTNNSILSSNQLFRYDEDQNYWIIYGSTGDPEAFGDASFVAAHGYSVAHDGAGVISFNGTVRTDDVTYAATYTADKGKGWNLVGNPFTSAIGVTNSASSTGKFLSDNSGVIDASYLALYIWDEQTTYENYRNDYKIISSGTINGYTKINQDYIEPGQAFMVKVKPTAGDLAFNENMQYHADVNFYKSKETWPSVELVVEGNGVSNSTSVGFHEDMTPGLDPSYDVGKLKGNPDIALYTRLVEDNGVDFAIQALPFENIETVEIPVGISVSTPGVYEFSASTTNFENYNIVLEDRQTNVFTNLRWGKYSVEINQNGIGRFYLQFKDATGIPDYSTEKEPLTFYTPSTLNIRNLQPGTYQITISDIAGRRVAAKQVSTDGSVEMPLSLQTGVYIVEVSSETTRVANKIIIK